MLHRLIVLATLLLPACFATAENYKVGALAIVQPWSQELPPNAPTIAAYFVIRNSGETADKLLSVDSPIAGTAQLHEHVKKDDLMKMQHVQSIEIPAGGQVTFAPMAFHVMLLELKDRSLLSDGKRFPLTLHFENSADVTVDVEVLKKAPDALQAHMHAQ